MATREAATEQTGAAAAEVAAADPASAAAGLDSVVLALQRTAGNRAVLNLLDRRAPHRTLQRRRVAGVGDLLDLLSNAAGPDAAAHLAGAQRMIKTAWDELSDADKAEVRKRRLHGLTDAQFKALPEG